MLKPKIHLISVTERLTQYRNGTDAQSISEKITANKALSLQELEKMTIRRSPMDRLVRQDLRMERQTGPCQVHHLCGEEAGSRNCRREEQTQKDTRCNDSFCHQKDCSFQHTHGAVVGTSVRDAFGVRGRCPIRDGVQPEGSGRTHGLHGTREAATTPMRDQHGDGHPQVGDSCEGVDREIRNPVNQA